MRHHISAAVVASFIFVLFTPAATSDIIEFRSLDGGGNNTAHSTWGQAGTDSRGRGVYLRRVHPPASAHP